MTAWAATEYLDIARQQAALNIGTMTYWRVTSAGLRLTSYIRQTVRNFVRIAYWDNTKKLLERKDIMPRKKKVEEEVKNEVIKGTEVSTETAAETKTKEMTVDEQYDLAKKALVIKAYNVLVKVEEFIDTIMAYTPNGEMAAKFAELADNLKAENFRKELIETIVGDKDKTEKDEE